MFSKHPALQSLQAPEPREGIWFTDPAVPARACCCPARPAVKIIMPPAPGRDHQVDLWLCRHHYRVSSGALHAAGVTTQDVTFMDAPAPAGEAAVHA